MDCPYLRQLVMMVCDYEGMSVDISPENLQIELPAFDVDVWRDRFSDNGRQRKLEEYEEHAKTAVTKDWYFLRRISGNEVAQDLNHLLDFLVDYNGIGSDIFPE